MRIDILTLFPGMFAGPLDESIVGRTREAKILDLRIHNLRAWTHDRHQTVDDRPFGGGPGMVLKPEPIFEAVEALRADGGGRGRVILTSPAGARFEQSIARRLATEQRLIFVCGSYEGFDDRIREHLADEELSIGDYVLTNGALPAMVMVDAVTRLLPGALGHNASANEESHTAGALEYPQYTRPVEFRGWKVPQVLQSGHHAEIGVWRLRQSWKCTAERRPDLWEKIRWQK